MVQSTCGYWCTLLILACGCQTTPNSPVPRQKTTSTPYMFVVRETSICPTPAQALSRECGNSVESSAMGYRLHRGERIEVDGNESAGTIGSPRYLVEGKTPGFVRTDDLALKPDLSHLQNAALNVPVQVDLRQTSVALVAEDHDGDRYPVNPAQILIGTKSFLLPCLATIDGLYFEDIHSCLSERDCDTLNYVCDGDYCDILLIEFEDSKVSAVADRYGVFKVGKCERYP